MCGIRKITTPETFTTRVTDSVLRERDRDGRGSRLIRDGKDEYYNERVPERD